MYRRPASMDANLANARLLVESTKALHARVRETIENAQAASSESKLLREAADDIHQRHMKALRRQPGI